MLIRTFLRVREFVMQSGNQRIFVGNNLNGRGTWGRLFRFLILRLNWSLMLFTEFFTSLHCGMRFFETITSTKCRTMLGFFILSKVELKFHVYSKRICSVPQLCCGYYLSDERWGYLGNFFLVFAPNRVKFLGEGASFCHQIFWQYICGTTSVYESINATVDMATNCGHTNYQKLRDERAGRQKKNFYLTTIPNVLNANYCKFGWDRGTYRMLSAEPLAGSQHSQQWSDGSGP